MAVGYLNEHILSVSAGKAPEHAKEGQRPKGAAAPAHPAKEQEQRAYLWSLRSPSMIKHTLKQCAAVAPNGLTAAKAVVPPAKGRRVAHLFSIVDQKPVLHVHQFAKEAPVAKWVVPEAMAAVAASPDGQYLAATASGSGALYLWQLSSGKLLRVVSHAHAKPARQLVWSHDGLALVSSGDDAVTHTWLLYTLLDQAMQTPMPAHTIHHLKPATAVLLDNAPYTLAKLFIFDEAKQGRIMHLATGIDAVPTLRFSATPTAAVLSSLASHLYVGMEDGSILPLNLYNKPQMAQPIESGIPQRFSSGHEGPVTSLAMSYDATLLVSGGQDGAIQIWDVRSYQVIDTCRPHAPGVAVTSLQVLLDPYTETASQDPLVSLERIISTDTELASGIATFADKSNMERIEEFERVEN